MILSELKIGELYSVINHIYITSFDLPTGKESLNNSFSITLAIGETFIPVIETKPPDDVRCLVCYYPTKDIYFLICTTTHVYKHLDDFFILVDQ